MAALTGKAAKVKYTAAAYSTSAAEAFTSLSASTDKTEFRITDGSKRHWTRDLPPVVLVNSTAHTDFSWNAVQGKLTFTGTPLTVAESAQVTATVYWLTASYLPWTRTWTADIDNTMLDVTSFSTSATDAQWRDFQAGLQGATVDLGRIVPVAPGTTGYTPLFFDRLNVGQDVIVELHLGSTYKLEAYAQVAGDGYTVPRDGLEEESVTLTVDGPMYYATTE
jgi:hypothetical protein